MSCSVYLSFQSCGWTLAQDLWVFPGSFFLTWSETFTAHTPWAWKQYWWKKYCFNFLRAGESQVLCWQVSMVIIYSKTASHRRQASAWRTCTGSLQLEEPALSPYSLKNLHWLPTAWRTCTGSLQLEEPALAPYSLKNLHLLPTAWRTCTCSLQLEEPALAPYSLKNLHLLPTAWRTCTCSLQLEEPALAPYSLKNLHLLPTAWSTCTGSLQLEEPALAPYSRSPPQSKGTLDKSFTFLFARTTFTQLALSWKSATVQTKALW